MNYENTSAIGQPSQYHTENASIPMPGKKPENLQKFAEYWFWPLRLPFQHFWPDIFHQHIKNSDEKNDLPCSEK